MRRHGADAARARLKPNHNLSFVLRLIAMPASDLSATEAAELLGMTRERLRQLVVAGELPDRLPGSSRYRPRYRRVDIEAYGHLTGRIAGPERPPPMDLVVDALTPRPPEVDRWAIGDPVAHVRVWERPGWPAVVLLGAPIDGDWGIRSNAREWEAAIRTRFLPETAFTSLWLLMPEHRFGWRDDGSARYLERTDATGGRDRGGDDGTTSWTERSHDDLQARVGGAVAEFPPGVYTRDVIAQVGRANGAQVEVEWDPYNLAGLLSSAIVLAQHSGSESPEDARIMMEGAWFIAGSARSVDEHGRTEMPPSTDAVAISSIELDASIWARIDELADAARTQPLGTASDDARRELARRRGGLGRLLTERGDSMPWRLREAVARARSFIPDVGDSHE